jgi:hypothetical protein
LTGLSDFAKEMVLANLQDIADNVYKFEDVQDDRDKFIEAVSWFGNLGAVFPTYKASFVNGKWELELIRMAVS